MKVKAFTATLTVFVAGALAGAGLASPLSGHSSIMHAPRTAPAAVAHSTSARVINVGSKHPSVNSPNMRASGRFGALYVNAQDLAGVRSWNYPTKRGAELAAYDRCVSEYGNCQGVFWVEDAECGAVGINKARTVIYYSFAYNSVRRAEEKIRRRRPGAAILGGTCGDRP